MVYCNIGTLIKLTPPLCIKLQEDPGIGRLAAGQLEGDVKRRSWEVIM